MHRQDEDTELEVADKSESRQTWVSHFEYVLSLFGYLSGAGDFWRFPYLFWKNGGGTYIIAYLTCIIIFSIPVYYLEVAVSQYSGKGMYDVWCICPLFAGMSTAMFIINLMMLLYLPTLRVWIMSYIRHSFSDVLPWTTCGNRWNTDACLTALSNKITNISSWNVSSYTKDNGSFASMNESRLQTMSSEEEFWKYEILYQSDGIEDIGTVNWELCLYNVMLRGLMVLCVIKSVKSIGKVMYVTTFIPFTLLTVLFIRTLLLPGVADGFIYFITPKLSKFTDLQMWLQAGFAALNSLGIGLGGTLVIASRGNFHSGILKSTICACTLDVFGTIFTSAVLFSVLGVMAQEQNKAIEVVVSSGTSIGFVGFTKAFSFLPAPKVWTIIFFFSAFVALLDVLVMIKEVVVDYIQRSIPYCRDRHLLVVLIVFLISSLLSLPFVTQAGPYIFQVTEWYSLSWCTLITTILECIIFTWIFGGDKIDDMVRCMLGRPMPAFLRFLAAFISPLVCIIFLFVGIFTFQPPTYGSYAYSSVAETFGYLLGILPVLPIPVVMVIKIYKSEGSIPERISTLLKPSSAWGSVQQNNCLKEIVNRNEKRTSKDTAFYNLTGRHMKVKSQDKGHALQPML